MSVQPHKIDALILVLLNYIAQHPNSAMASPPEVSGYTMDQVYLHLKICADNEWIEKYQACNNEVGDPIFMRIGIVTHAGLREATRLRKIHGDTN